MAFGELGRIAVETDDLEGVAHDLRAVFGMEIDLHEGSSEALGIRAGVGQDGIELVQRVVAEPAPAKYWRPPLAALIAAVDDLEQADERMRGIGVELVQTVVTGSGFRELFYGANFHGIPLVLYQKDEEGLLHAPARAETVVDWEPKGVPAPMAGAEPGEPHGSNASGQLSRIALVVDDLDAVARDLDRVFDLGLTLIDVPAMGIRAAIGEHGLELVQPSVEAPEVAAYWRGPVAAVCVATDDVDAAAERMREAGIGLVKSTTTQGGLRELYYGANFHGIPLTICDRSEEGFVQAALGADHGGVSAPVSEWVVPAAS
jgi:hypothetical protein